MEGIIVPKNYPTFSRANDIRTVCEPLFKISDINMVAYFRIYKNGDMFDLSTNTEFKKHMLFNLQGEVLFNFNLFDIISDSKQFAKNKENKTRWFLTEVYRGSNWKKILNDFNIDNYFCITEKFENYYECFEFATCLGKNISSFYVNHYDILEKFIFYFKDRGADLINAGEKNRIFAPHRNTDYYCMLKELESRVSGGKKNQLILNEHFRLKRYPLFCGYIKTYITYRELECLRWLSHGYTSKEMGDILQISSRTIETHLQNIKNKLGISSQGELLKIYRSSSLINLQ